MDVSRHDWHGAQRENLVAGNDADILAASRAFSSKNSACPGSWRRLPEGTRRGSPRPSRQDFDF
jgi:hypothetical protein